MSAQLVSFFVFSLFVLCCFGLYPFSVCLRQNLHTAARQGLVDVVVALLEQGAMPDEIDEVRTTLPPLPRFRTCTSRSRMHCVSSSMIHPFSTPCTLRTPIRR